MVDVVDVTRKGGPFGFAVDAQNAPLYNPQTKPAHTNPSS